MTIILDASRREVARASARVALAPGQVAAASVELAVPRPHRWSVTDSYLYSVETHVRTGGRDVDVTREPLGIRTIEFAPD